MKPRYLASLLSVTLAGMAAPALAAECTVNVHDAYIAAMKRGWQFKCLLWDEIGRGQGPVQAKFATYPPDKIGCSVKTPPVVPGRAYIYGFLFGNSGVSNSDGRTLRDGWSVDRYEVTGKQYSVLNPLDGTLISRRSRIVFQTADLAANNSYNVKLSKLVLKKSNGNCAKAIAEAF
jgi:hypothetical protein